MMKRYIFLFITTLAVIMSLLSCGDEIRPKRTVTDLYGVVFLEDGKLDTVNTNITSQQLREALVENRWEYSYSFFYDDYDIGNHLEDLHYSRFIYEYRSDGTVTATDLSDGKTYDYNYTVDERVITLSNSKVRFSIGVVALDSRHMVCDESLAGEVIYDYDRATVTRRIVFKTRK